MAEKAALTVIDPNDAAIAAEAATKGDLSQLSAQQRVQLYGAVCKSMGLNPLSRPFEYIELNRRLTLYATRTATDQLRKINAVSITSIEQVIDDGVLIVTVRAQDASGRTDMEIGAVTVAGLKGEALANARMKAITKAKRRVTLSISGLGWLDESEVATVPSATPVSVDQISGEVLDAEPVSLDGEKVMRRLHAVAKNAGIGHEQLSDWAHAKHKVLSLRDVDPGTLNELATWIDNSPEAAAKTFHGHYPGVDSPTVTAVVDEDAAYDIEGEVVS